VSESRHTAQSAGDQATQVGTIGGNFIQHVHQRVQSRIGFWGCSTVAVITLGLLFWGAMKLGAGMEDRNPDDDESWRDDGASSAFGNWGEMDGSPGFGSQPGANYVLGGAGQASAVPLANGFDAGLARAQRIQFGVQVMQYVDAVKAEAVRTQNLMELSTAFAGPALAYFSSMVMQSAAQGLVDQPVLESGRVLDVRLVSSGPWSSVIEIDACEAWSITTWNGWGAMVNFQPARPIPRTLTVEVGPGRTQVTDLDFAVFLAGCP
jgi:hypothetical protein